MKRNIKTKGVLCLALLLLISLAAAAQPLTLEESITQAVSEGAAGRMLQGSLDLDAILVQEKGVPLETKLTAKGGANWGEKPFSIGSLEDRLSFNQQSLTLEIQHPVIWMSKALSAAQSSLGHEGDLAQLRWEQGLADLAYQVVEVYFGCLKAQRMGELAKEAVRVARWNMDVVQARFNVGTATIAEVLAAEADLKEARLQELQSQEGQKAAQMAFNVLLGRSLDEPVELVDPGAPSVAVPHPLEVLPLAKANRPDLLRAQAELALAELGELAACEEGRPILALVGQYQWEDGEIALSLNSRGLLGLSGTYNRQDSELVTNKEIDLDGSEGDSYLAGLQVQWPLFDGGASKLKQEKAKEGVKLARLAVEQLETQLELELNSLHLALERSGARLELARGRLDEMTERLRTTQKLHEAQLATDFDVAQLELAVLGAESDVAVALCDLHVAKAAYLKGVYGPSFLREM
ncbi:MAG: TolC family protein [Firmicutes bacterium]|nr:TolC family protein [Bacillota bacterium]